MAGPGLISQSQQPRSDDRVESFAHPSPRNMKTLSQCWFASRLCLGLLFASLLPALAVDKPVGTFASAGANGNPADSTTIYGDAQLKGVLIRAYWSTLEPTAGNFIFNSLTNQISNAESQGLSWSLAIMGGGIGSPAWLTNPTNQGGLGAPYITYSFRGVPGYKLPLFWNSIVQTRLEMLADALAAEYNNNTSLKLVYVTQMTSNGIEGHLQGVSMPTFVAAGYTDANWISASKQAAKSFADAFTNKAIAFEVHDVNGTHTVPETIINDLWNDPTLGQRVGAAMWWISGKTSYQSNLITALMNYPGDIYGQVIAKSYEGAWIKDTYYPVGTVRMPSGTPPPAVNLYRYEVTTAGTSAGTEPNWPTTVNATVTDGGVVWTCRASHFENGDYTTVFDQAVQLGMRYIEPWDFEFTDTANSAHRAWDSTFEDFNDWSEYVFIEAPAAPTGLTATAGNAQVQLAWTNPTDLDLAGIRVLRKTGSYPSSATDGSATVVLDDNSAPFDTSVTSTGLTNGTTYYYAVYAYDAQPNYSTPAQATGTPSAPVTVTFESNATDDGWVLESSETSGTGGSTNSGNTTGLVGDDASRKQYKMIVSFDTSSIPDGAVIDTATLKLTRSTVNGTNPFTWASNVCYADISNGGFNGSATLENADFSASASAAQVATMSAPASNNTQSTGALNATGRGQVNKTGKTQFRVYFAQDDNNNSTADNMVFYSSNYTTDTSRRPKLEVTYHMP